MFKFQAVLTVQWASADLEVSQEDNGDAAKRLVVRLGSRSLKHRIDFPDIHGLVEDEQSNFVSFVLEHPQLGMRHQRLGWKPQKSLQGIGGRGRCHNGQEAVVVAVAQLHAILGEEAQGVEKCGRPFSSPTFDVEEHLMTLFDAVSLGSEYKLADVAERRRQVQFLHPEVAQTHGSEKSIPPIKKAETGTLSKHDFVQSASSVDGKSVA